MVKKGRILRLGNEYFNIIIVVRIPTDKLFTGQPLDGTGLYYYNARYYNPERLS